MSLKSTNHFWNVLRKFFGGGQSLTEEIDGNLADILHYQRARQRGVIPSARLPFSVNPSNNDTIGIGADTVKFVTALGAAGAQHQVKIGADAATTLASLLNLINGVADATVVPATTAFAEKLLADSAIATTLRIRLADKQGGTPTPAVSASMALTASITGGGAWDVANLDATGKELTTQDYAVIEFAVTAEMVTATSKAVELDFTPAHVHSNAEQAAFSISGNAVVVAMADGAGNPYFQAGETVRAVAFA